MSRPRLFARLDTLCQAPLAWVAAPAGSGKTTLVGSYLAERGCSGLWIQLGADDADIASFFYYLGLAVEHGASRPGAGLPTLLPAHLPALSGFTRRCAEAIAARFDSPALIVLDNYEQVPANAALHSVVRELAEALPRGLSLLVLGRTEPPAPYARLRLNEGLAMLAACELNLSADEASAVVAARAPRLPGRAAAECVDQLMRQTEGWFAGFTLLLGDGRLADPPDQQVATQQLLFDYFASELFGHLDATTQDALLQTSLLPAMSAADAEKVCGHSSVGSMLCDLHRRNCFVVQRGSADPQYAHYEYHALFRAFLMDRAAQLLPADEWRALQRRSAEVLVQAGQTDAAAGLYRAAQDWPALAALALREAPALVAAGRHRTLEAWMVGLPDAAFERSPWLHHWRAVARLPFDPVAARGAFELAYEGFERADDVVGLYATWAGAMESFFFEWRDFRLADRWIAEYECLRARHPAFPSRAIELRSYCAMGTLLHRQPQHPMLPAWAERATALIDPADRDMSAMLGGYLIIWHHWRGDVVQARAIVDRITPLAVPSTSPMVLILWFCATAFHHSVRGDTSACLTAVEAGLALAERSCLHAFNFLLAAQMARCHLVAGDPDAAELWLAKMAGAMRCHSHIDGAFYQHLQCHAAAQRGSWQLALDHGRGAMAMALESGVPFVIATCHIALARALIGRGDAADAAAHVRSAREIGDLMGSRVVECLCLEIEARAAHDQGLQAVVLDRLGGALALSRAMDGSTWNVAGPQANARLYKLALDAEIEVEHVQGLIRRLRIAAPESANVSGAWPWPVRIYTLGRFDILIDDRPLRAAGKPQHKPLELLKCLCALGGVGVRQERLADALWPEAEGDAAEQAFRTTLHRLRKLLRHDAAIRVEDRQVTLDGRWVWVDCLAFDRVAHLPSANAPTILQAALGRYRGHFLHDESAQWAHNFRARLRAQFITMAEALGKLLEEDEDWTGATRCYLHALEVDPEGEGFHRRLMQVYARSGRRAEALSVYQRCRQTLLSRQGISPAPETQALYRDLAGS